MANISDTIVPIFITGSLATGVALNADALPVGVLRKNGTTVAGATVTVTNLGAGRYKASVLLDPAHGWADRDSYAVEIEYTMEGAAGFVLPAAQGLVRLPVYQAKVSLVDDNGGAADRYSVIFYKDGKAVTTGITSPLIQVYKNADGTDLIASVALTAVASLGYYRHAEATNRIVDGVSYTVKVTATIAGLTQSWFHPVGRDSA